MISYWSYVMNSLNDLGLAFRARKAKSGTEIVLDEMRKGRIYVIYLANDASSNTQKTVKDKASYYNVRVITAYSSNELSNAIGLKNRMIVGVTDSGFANIICKKEKMR